MQVKDGVSVETYLGSLFHQKFYGSLVVQYHLRFQGILAFGVLPEFQQSLGFEQRVGIAFESAGVPGKIDQQAIENLSYIGSSRILLFRRAPHL